MNHAKPEHDWPDMARRTVQGSLYSGAAGFFTVILGFIRTALLARLLLPEHFGVVALAAVFLMWDVRLIGSYVDRAYIHRQDVTAAFRGTYFSAKLLTVLVRSLALLAAAPLLQRLYPEMPELGRVLMAFAAVSLLNGLMRLQETLLKKEMSFGRLAAADVVAAVAMAVVSPTLAWFGWGIWALVADRLVDVASRVLFLVPSTLSRWSALCWDRSSLTFLWQYSKPVWVQSNLAYFLERFDHFWIGTALGETPLGFYSRAFFFSQAPRRVFALPTGKVFEPLFARLQDQRVRLSQVFSMLGRLFLSAVFFGVGYFSLVMPEFINFVIGTKWMPMLWTFRLLLVYAAFDSWFQLVVRLLSAVGSTRILRRVAIVQTLFFVPAVILAAYLAGILGVAIVADLVVLLGIWGTYSSVKEAVDFSFWRIIRWPVVALANSLTAGIALEFVWQEFAWQLILAKSFLFAGLFVGSLALLDRRSYIGDLRQIWRILRGPHQESVSLSG